MKSLKDLKAAKKFGPGYFIKELMDGKSWVQEDLADVLDITPKHLNNILSDKQSLSIEIAEKLSKVFGTSVKFWLNIDTDYRIWLRENTEKADEHKTSIKAELYNYMPVRELRKINWFSKNRDFESLIKDTNDFWDTDKLDFSKMEEAAVVYQKKSSCFEQNPHFLATWFQKAKKVSEKIEVASFNRDRLESVYSNIASFSNLENGIAKFLNELEQCGLKFFVLPHLEKTFLDGAAFLHNNEYSVVYTARHNRIDNFWFTIAHEIAHILKHIDEDVNHVLDNLDDEATSDIENEANEIAAEKLKHYKIIAMLEPYSKYLQDFRIADASKILNVHPSIIIGTLAYHKIIPFSRASKYKEEVIELIPEKYKY